MLQVPPGRCTCRPCGGGVDGLRTGSVSVERREDRLGEGRRVPAVRRAHRRASDQGPYPGERTAVVDWRRCSRHAAGERAPRRHPGGPGTGAGEVGRTCSCAATGSAGLCASGCFGGPTGAGVTRGGVGVCSPCRSACGGRASDAAPAQQHEAPASGGGRSGSAGQWRQQRELGHHAGDIHRRRASTGRGAGAIEHRAPVSGAV